MKKAITAAIACNVVIPVIATAQIVAPPPAGPVAQPAAVGAAAPAPAQVDPGLAALPLHKLLAVQNVHERRTHWQKAADEAVARIDDAKLKAVVSQRIAHLAPTIAEALIGHSGQSAMLTVAVYKDRTNGAQALAAVAFEGLGRDLNPSFYPRVLADLPQAPGGQEDQSQKFQLDANATSYLCFFLDHGDLKAGDITHAQMKQSLGLALDKAHQEAAAPAIAAARAAQQQAAQQQQAQAALQQAAIDQQIRQARLDQQQQDLNQQAANQNAIGFSSPYWNSGAWGGAYGGAGFGGYGGGAGGYGYGVGYGWSPWLAYAPGQNGYPANEPPHIVAPGYMPPNVVARRDPRTGQPITPTIVATPGSAPGAVLPPYNATPAQRDPSTGQPIAPTPPVYPSQSSSGSADAGNSDNGQPTAAPGNGQPAVAPGGGGIYERPWRGTGSPAQRHEPGQPRTSGHAEPRPAPTPPAPQPAPAPAPAPTHR